jgi:hypothetical protein
MTGFQARAVSWRGLRPSTWRVDGFVGMLDAKAHAPERPGTPPLLLNMLPQDRAHGGPAVMRPGMRRLLAGMGDGAGTTLQIGSGAAGSSTRRCQGWISAEIASTGIRTFVWVGQELYEIDVNAATATLRISAAALAAATGGAVVLNISNPIHGVAFNGKFIFCQASATCPFSWDGTSLGGVARLTNAPASVVGPPTVYYAKLFFIQTGTQTIMWSEENQENTGYASGGFNNAWELTQTSEATLGQLVGTNEGLYYGRRGAIGVIRGAVSSTFTTDGVHESVSAGIGVTDPGSNIAGRSMHYYQGKLWWTDELKRPFAYQAGSGVLPIFKDLPRYFGQHNLYNGPDIDTWHVGEDVFGSLDLLGITHDEQHDTLRFHYSRAAATAGTGTQFQRIDLVVDGTTAMPLCWDIFPVTNPISTRSCLPVHFTQFAPQAVWGELYVDSSGYMFSRAYSHQHIAGTNAVTYFDATQDAVGTAVVGTIVGPEHAYSGRGEVKFTDLDLVVAGQTNQVVSAALLTSRKQKLNQVTLQTLTDAPATTTPFERHVAFGFNQDGRWARVVARVQAGASTDTPLRPEIHGWELRGYRQADTHAVT